MLADLDEDEKLDIITRVTSYSANNHVLVYRVNGMVQDADSIDDDTTGDVGRSFLEDNMMLIILVIVLVIIGVVKIFC